MGYQDLEDWLKSSDHVYIGRDMSFYVKGAKGSKWANPFQVSKYGLDKALELYTEYIKNDTGLMDSLKELEGKVLGCWCITETNKKCHGQILVDLIKQKNIEN
jgi:hypothetical protein